MRQFLPLMLALFAAAAVGCSDDIATPDPPLSNEIAGSVDTGEGDFSIEVGLATTPNGLAEGPFLLRGSNLHYDDLTSSLSVDLTVTNGGTEDQPTPVDLVFTQILPFDVIVANADEQTPDGPSITFDFANDDLVWSAGEKSLPHTVRFEVEPDVAVAFVAELRLGDATPGAVAGVVWEDANGDGERQSWEWGMADITVRLYDTSDDNSSGPTWDTVTLADGSFRFDDLPAGTYIATLPRSKDRPYAPTTPGEINVLLGPVPGGGATEFPDADFGLVFSGVENGDFLYMHGYYELGPPPTGSSSPSSPVFVGRSIEWIDCSGISDPTCNPVTCPCGDEPIETLCGWVNSIDDEGINMFGYKFRFPDDTSGLDLDWEAGDRVCLRVRSGPTTLPTIIDIDAYEGEDEIIYGVVREYAFPSETNLFLAANIPVCVGRCAPPPSR